MFVTGCRTVFVFNLYVRSWDGRGAALIDGSVRIDITEWIPGLLSDGNDNGIGRDPSSRQKGGIRPSIVDIVVKKRR